MPQPRKIEKIIVHCSASPDDRDIGLLEINQWHKERGFSGIEVDGVRIYCGYHAIIKRDGTLQIGRPEWAVGAHAQYHNSRSLGICWVGIHDMDPEQRKTLINLLRMWMLKYALEIKDVIGHCEVNKHKTCPNISMDELRRDLELDMGGIH